MHLDAVTLAIVEGVMAEAVEIEIGAELAVDAAQQIEIELRGDAGGVVIGGVEDRRSFTRSTPMISCAPGPRMLRGMAQERAASCGSKLPMVEPGKEADLRHAGDRGRQRERLGEIGRDRKHRKLGKVRCASRLASLARKSPGNVDRHIGRDLAQRCEQDPHLGAGAAAELDQRRAGRE